jgi:hypothetical protein
MAWIQFEELSALFRLAHQWGNRRDHHSQTLASNVRILEAARHSHFAKLREESVCRA